MHTYLLVIAVILISAKFFGLISQKVHMPQVVGSLFAGIILGPSVLGVVSESDFIVKSAAIGVIILMFIAGLDTELSELKNTGVASFVIALFGIFVPMIGGFLTYSFFFKDTGTLDGFLQAGFIGVVLTATSVSITVETLREMGKLKTKVGTAILGAAIIDDIIGIVSLAFIMGFKDKDVNIQDIFVNIILFFVFVIIVYFVVKVFSSKINRYNEKRRAAIYGFCFCLVMAYIAEEVFGVSDITGAYFAGIILCNTGVKEYIVKKITVSSYMFFAPMFFAGIGIKTYINDISSDMLIFSLTLLIVAILTKIVGCGVGAFMMKFNAKDSLSIGTGMVSRGEVALIMAEKGSYVGLLGTAMFPPVLLVVIFTTLITPILLKIVMSKK